MSSGLDVLTLLRLTAFLLHTAAQLSRAASWQRTDFAYEFPAEMLVLLTSRAWAWRRLTVTEQKGVLLVSTEQCELISYLQPWCCLGMCSVCHVTHWCQQAIVLAGVTSRSTMRMRKKHLRKPACRRWWWLLVLAVKQTNTDRHICGNKFCQSDIPLACFWKWGEISILHDVHSDSYWSWHQNRRPGHRGRLESRVGHWWQHRSICLSASAPAFLSVSYGVSVGEEGKRCFCPPMYACYLGGFKSSGN